MLEYEHMIAKLKGSIGYIKDNYAVIDVSNIGYKVFLMAHSLGKIAGQEAAQYVAANPR